MQLGMSGEGVCKLTQSQLKLLLDYDVETGVFRWKTRARNNISVGGIAGFKNAEGYIKIKIQRKTYSAHRLAWFYMLGVWPEKLIDHINGVRSDNSWKNIRQSTDALNAQNRRRAARTNKLGILGVTKVGKKYSAHIWIDGRQISLGTYDNPDLAHSVYLERKRQCHPGNTL